MYKTARQKARERRQQLDAMEAKDLMDEASRETRLAKRLDASGADKRMIRMIKNAVNGKLDRAGVLLGEKVQRSHKPTLEHSTAVHGRVRYG